MAERLKDRVAIVVGAGQSPGPTPAIGNGRATAMLFAREGAKVLSVDREIGLAEETAELIQGEGNEASAAECDITDEARIEAMVATAMERYGRIDILHNNVGISVAGNDASPTEITTEAFDLITAVNLRGSVMTVKHTLPVMREQLSGAIVNISSMAAWTAYPWVAYKATKSAMIAWTKQVAIQNAEFGIRSNVILPGLMDTPMAVDTRAREWDRPREEIAAERDARVPLRGKMGTGWDVAQAALFLVSDESQFITGVVLPVDGGSSCRTG